MNPSRRGLLAGAAALAAAPRWARAAADPGVGVTDHGITAAEALAAARDRPHSLAGKAARTGLLIGTSLNSWDMGDTAYLGAIAEDSSILVAENALKANQYRRSPDRFDFTDADKVYSFAAQNRMAFRGHTLCWFNSVPDWVRRMLTTPEAIRAELIAEVREPVRHFAGRMHSWDVVNEVLRPEDGNALGLRNSFWQQALGPDFIDLAFHIARENDPDAILGLNEMDLEYDHPYFETKRQALLALLKRLVAANVPIGAVGIQCHLQYVQIQKFPFSKTVFQKFLSDIASLGLKVIISELDVPDRNLPADVAERDTIVADAIGDLLSVAVDHPAVIAIVTWCLTDRYSWMSRDPTFRRSDGLRSRGTLLDDALAPKPAYWAVVKALDAASVRR